MEEKERKKRNFLTAGSYLLSHWEHINITAFNCSLHYVKRLANILSRQFLVASKSHSILLTTQFVSSHLQIITLKSINHYNKAEPVFPPRHPITLPSSPMRKCVNKEDDEMANYRKLATQQSLGLARSFVHFCFS